MPKRSASMEIQAPIDEVFSEIPTSWLRMLEQVSTGDVGLGTKYAMKTDLVKEKKSVPCEITTFSPPTSFGLTISMGKGSKPCIVHYDLTSQGAMTHVVLQASIRETPMNIVFGMGLFAPIVIGLHMKMLRVLDPPMMLSELKKRVDMYN